MEFMSRDLSSLSSEHSEYISIFSESTYYLNRGSRTAQTSVRGDTSKYPDLSLTWIYPSSATFGKLLKLEGGGGRELRILRNTKGRERAVLQRRQPIQRRRF